MKLPPGRADDKVKRYYLKHGIVLAPETPADLAPYKEPLEPVEAGFGYYGTVAQNKERTHIQCHICGYFFKSLIAHVAKLHGLKAREYKQEFQLALTKGLTAEMSRVKRIRSALAQPTAEKARFLKVLGSQRRGRTYEARTLTLETKNKRGRCYYQLLEKIEALGKKLKRTPTRRDFIAEHGDGGDLSSIYRTFGTWNQAVSFAGFTPNRYMGSRAKYDEGTVIAMIRNFYELEGRPPRRSDLGDLLPGGHVIERLFGGLVEARRAAGLGQADFVHESEAA